MPGPRRLSDLERSLVGLIPLAIDCSRVRLYRASCRGWLAGLRRLVLLASRNRAIALGNHVFLPDRCQGDLGRARARADPLRRSIRPGDR